VKYIGIAAMLLSALLFSREYSRYMKKRLSECEGFLSFMSHIRIQIGCFLKPSRELCDGFSNDALSDCGFIDELRSTGDIYGAYKNAEPRLAMSCEAREISDNLFSALGAGYREDGVRLIDESEKKMQKICDELRASTPKSVRLALTLSVTAVLGFSILII